MCGRKWLGPTQAGLSVCFGLEEACLSQLRCLLPYTSPAALGIAIRAWLCSVVRADMTSGPQLLMGDDLASSLEHNSLESATAGQEEPGNRASLFHVILGQWHLGLFFSCPVLVI